MFNVRETGSAVTTASRQWSGWDGALAHAVPPLARLPMQINTDAATYDVLQRYLARVIAEEVRDRLRESASSGASLEEAVQSIAVGVAAIVDGSRDLEHEGKPVLPMLTFATLDEDERVTSLLTSGEPSRLNELVEQAAVEAGDRGGTGG